MINETPQIAPKINHWGETNPDTADFFKLPKNIGEIISGYTTLYKDADPRDLRSLSRGYLHRCSYIGVNGFAIFELSGNRNNSIGGFEINFDDITDLFSYTQKNSLNYVYQSTDYCYIWSNKDILIKDFIHSHDSRKDNPHRDDHIVYWTNKWAEKQWTNYLLNKMELEIERNGFIEFRINEDSVIKPYIKLGSDYITFIERKGEVNYNSKDIKKVYIVENKLFIEHNNYQQKYLFFSSGNKNEIHLSSLLNQQFFLKAMEILLGFKFS